jgi:hypothetical protein
MATFAELAAQEAEIKRALMESSDPVTEAALVRHL